MHAVDNGVDAVPLGKFNTDMPVAALGTGTGSDHVAHASQSGESLRPTAQHGSQSGHLRQPPGNERGAGIVPGTQAIAHAHRDGNNIFEHTAQFAADMVRVGIDPEQADIEQGLQPALGRRVVQCQDAGGGLSRHNFPCQVGSGEHADGPPRGYLPTDFGHA